MTLKIEMYTKTICQYCDKAKALLRLKNVSDHLVEYNIEREYSLLKEMLERSGGRKTVPQIFINGIHIGGCDDLYELEEQNKLDILLK